VIGVLRQVTATRYVTPLREGGSLPGVVEGIVWTGIWDSNTGLLNSVLSSLHLISDYHVFLGHNRLLTVFAIEVVQVWQITPLSALLVLAALQNVPGDLHEAAQLDGAGAIRQFFSITLPQLKYTIITSSTLMVVGSLTFFDLIWVLTAGGPSDATRVLAVQMYIKGFQGSEMGPASAIAVILVFVGLGLALLLRRLGGDARESQMEGA